MASPTEEYICVSKPSSDNIDLEIRECRHNGYLLTDKFLGEGAYARVFAGEATLQRVESNYKLREVNRGFRRVVVSVAEFTLF